MIGRALVRGICGSQLVGSQLAGALPDAVVKQRERARGLPHATRRAFSGSVRVTAFSLALLAFAACDNMKHQPNLRSDVPTPHFANGTSAQRAPTHSVAHGGPALNDVTATGLREGQPVREFPVPITPALLARGRERFGVYCAPCHGDDGYAQGIVVRRGFPPPPSLHEERLRTAPVGHFFDVMTRGYGIMYPYAERVAVSDRWAIAAYIRALQRSQHATIADVPAAQRQALLAP